LVASPDVENCTEARQPFCIILHSKTFSLWQIKETAEESLIEDWLLLTKKPVKEYQGKAARQAEAATAPVADPAANNLPAAEAPVEKVPVRVAILQVVAGKHH
jgi:hypothetical protein